MIRVTCGQTSYHYVHHGATGQRVRIKVKLGLGSCQC